MRPFKAMRQGVIRAVSAALSAMLLASCLEPTQVTFDIKTDVPCEEVNGTAITAALEGEAERAEPVKIVQTCRTDGNVGSIGSWAVYPKGSHDVVMTFKVVIAVASGIEVASCTPANKYRGCVVARRRISFVPHRNLQVPVELLRVCQNVQCDMNSTCTRAGTCMSAVVNTEACETGDSCTKLATPLNLPCFNNEGAAVFCGGDLGWCTRTSDGVRACAEASLPGGSSYQCRNTMDCGPSLKCVSGPAGILGMCVVGLPSGAMVLCGPSDVPSPCAAGPRGCFVDAGQGFLTCGTPPPDAGFPDAGYFTQDAYLKAPHIGLDDEYGNAVALSADGTTLAVGDYQENSNIGGINPQAYDSNRERAGAVGVYRRSGTSWVQEAWIKAAVPGLRARFGASVALSADGNTLAVGAFKQDVRMTLNLKDAGLVYIFRRTGSTWVEETTVQPNVSNAGAWFGTGVSLSGDGNWLAVAAPLESSGTRADGGAGGAGTEPESGAVYVFERTAPTTWVQRAFLKASNHGAGDHFGAAVSMSSAGDTLAVGAPLEDSASAGIDGEQNDEGASNSGAAYIFKRDGVTWTQQAYLKASNSGAEDNFGALQLSADGLTLGVAATGEASAATGIDGTQTDESAPHAGAVYIFQFDGQAWAQQAYLKSTNTRAGDYFGWSLGFSGNGDLLAAARPGTDVFSIPDGGVDDGGVHERYASVVLFQRSEGAWREVNAVQAGHRYPNAWFGNSTQLSHDGQVLAIGDVGEAGGSPGVNGDTSLQTVPGAGAAFPFSRH